VEKSVTASPKIKEVKSAEDIEKVVKDLQPGQQVTISFAGKELIIEAKK
jgi:hypothetical protein